MLTGMRSKLRSQVFAIILSCMAAYWAIYVSRTALALLLVSLPISFRSTQFWGSCIVAVALVSLPSGVCGTKCLLFAALPV